MNLNINYLHNTWKTKITSQIELFRSENISSFITFYLTLLKKIEILKIFK